MLHIASTHRTVASTRSHMYRMNIMKCVLERVNIWWANSSEKLRFAAFVPLPTKVIKSSTLYFFALCLFTTYCRSAGAAAHTALVFATEFAPQRCFFHLQFNYNSSECMSVSLCLNAQFASGSVTLDQASNVSKTTLMNISRPLQV